MSDATDDGVMTEAELLALWVNARPPCRSPTADAALTRWRRMCGALRFPYKGEFVAVIEQDGGGFVCHALSSDLYVAHLTRKIPRGRMTIRRA